MPLTDSLLAEDDTDIQPAPRPRARTGKLRNWSVSPEALDHLDQLANIQAPKPTATTEQAKQKEPLGVLGTIKEGAKSTLRALGATVDTAQGDEAGVVNAAKEQTEAEKDPRLAAFLSDIDERKKALTDPSLWEGIKAVGGAAIKNPAGFGLMIAEQAPNSVAALGAGGAGALAGSAFGPAGTVIGGLAGLGLANVGLETGNKAIEAAQDGAFTPEEQSRVRKEGLTKGAVITGVDALTLGATKWITGATRRAVETATTKTLADHGVDVTNAAARKAAMTDPAIKESVKTAQDLAKQSTDKLGKRLARTGGAVALETVGEGAGEYLGEFAASGKPNTIEAVIEAFAGFGQSAGEIALTSALNRQGMKRLFDNPEEAEKVAKEESAKTHIPHEAVPHPTEPDKFVAVPKTRSISGIEFERDAEGNLSPISTPSTQADFNLANKPGFEHTAEDKIREQELAKAQEAAYAKNPIIVPGAKPTSPTIAGKPAADMSNNALIYTVNRGSARAKKIATDELARRENEGSDPVTDNAPETPADTVNRIVATGAERAKEDAKKLQPILTPAPKAEKPATAPKTKPQPAPEPKKVAKPAKTSAPKPESKPKPVVQPTKPEVIKNAKAEPTQKVPETKPIPTGTQGIPQSTQTAGKQERPVTVAPVAPSPEAEGTGGAAPKIQSGKQVSQNSQTVPTVSQNILPHIDALIKRRAAARQIGKERTFDKALADAKAMLAGEKVSPARFKNAAKLFANDKATADILSTLQAKAEETNRAAKAKQPSPSENPKPEEDWLITLFGNTRNAKKEQTETKNQIKSNIPDITSTLTSAKEEAQKRLKEWTEKKYKANRKQITFEGDGPTRNESKSISSLNEGRRLKVIEATRQEILAIENIEKTLTDNTSKDRLTTLLEQTMLDAKNAHSSGLTGDANSGSTFERMLLERLGIRPHKGSYTSTPLSKILREAVESANKKPAFSRSKTPAPKSQSRSNVESVINSIKAKWKNAPDVVVIDSITDAPAAVQEENQRQLSMGASGEPEGFISGNKVYIVASQMKTPGDVVRVLLHESLGHFGLHGVFGAELQSILKHVAALRKSEIATKAKQYGLNISNEADRLTAAEEVLAEMAQGNPQNNLVRRAIAAIHKWLRANIPGFQNLRLSDSEIIQDILIPARQFVEQGGKAAPAQGVMFSRSPATIKSAIRDRIDKISDSLIYNFQDRFKPLKDIQERSGPVAEDEDAALAEERYSGMVRARTDSFEEQLRDPLLKAIHDSGVAYEDVEKYLHALHAPSRNAAMREINPTAAELTSQTSALEKQRDSLTKDPDVTQYLKLRRELREAEAEIEDGLADESLAVAIKRDIAQIKKVQNVADYTEALDKLKALRLVKPFQGDNTALSGMSDAEAKAILDKIDANGTRKALERVSALVDDITSKTRQIYVDSGLEKANVIDAWNKKYEHYVPLHRDEVGGNSMPRIGQGFNIRGKESKRATGSTKDVTNILAHVVAQHEAAIIRSEKSKVDRTLLRFAQLHPDPSLWTLDEAPMLRTVDPNSGLVVERVDPTYKNRPEVLTLKIDGEEHTITFNDKNEEAMRLAASMKNLSSEQLGEVTQLVGRFTRGLAIMNTTANPVFTARNFLRDLQTTFVNLSDTALADKKAAVFRDVGSAIKGMWDLSRGKKNSQWAKYAEEFKAAGGQTGWMDHYNNIGERAESLKKELERMGPGKKNLAWRTAKSWWDIVQDANNAVENGARLSAYVNARKSGLSAGKAAQLAKNLTVNFNARGAKSAELNAWYMFMNASIQGTARIAKALSNRQVRKIVAGVILSGFLMDILARSLAGDEDDDGENDYDQLPEHVKAMNFVLMVNNRPVTIPMPYGYNFFASAGRKISEVMFRTHYSPVKSAADLTGVFLDAFSPTGQAGSFLQYLSPTVTDPFVQWSENKNFAGNPLRRPQSPFGVPNPEYQMGFKSTSAPAKWLAEMLNNETGGNEVRPGFVNVNPAFFDFAVSSIAGGAGRTYLQTTSAPMKIAQGEDLKAKEIPFLNIFLGAKPEYQTEKKYFEAIRAVETAKDELKTYRQKGDQEMVKQILEDHGHEIRLQAAAKETKNLLTRLRKRDLALDKTQPPNLRELRKQIEDQRREAMARFNKQYRQAVEAH